MMIAIIMMIFATYRLTQNCLSLLAWSYTDNLQAGFASQDGNFMNNFRGKKSINAQVEMFLEIDFTYGCQFSEWSDAKSVSDRRSKWVIEDLHS